MAQTEIIVVIDRPAVAEYVSWAGPLGRKMELCAREIAFRSRVTANKRTGKLAGSIDWKRGKAKAGITATIGSPVPYAAIIEQGSKPHEIKPKKPGGYLVFFWPKAGKVVYLQRVWHPGTRPYRFLTKALEKGVRSIF